MEKKFAIILAAGKGTRMKSRDENHPKATLPILGKELINYVIDAIEPFNMDKIIAVVGFGGEKTTRRIHNRALTVWQKELLGTGHAVKQANELLKDEDGLTLVMCGDTPLVTTETLQALFHKHEKENNSVTVVTSVLRDPTSYGRIIRKKPTNKIIAIREDSDCSEEESYITEINAGIYVFNNKLLFSYIDKLNNDNAQKEYYLTDLIEMFDKDGLKVGNFIVEDPIEVFGINDRFQLSYAAKIIRKRVNRKLMMSGVSIEDPDTAYISPDATIGRDTVILPNVSVLGKTSIGEGNTIGPNVYIKNSVIGDENRIYFSYIKNQKIGNNQKVEFENKKD